MFICLSDAYIIGVCVSEIECLMDTLKKLIQTEKCMHFMHVNVWAPITLS